MVVLEGANISIPMLTIGNNQYLQPDYLSPGNPATLDSKKSPLALLAQTCSQIGADSNSVKSSLVTSANEKSGNKKMDNTQTKPQPTAIVQQKMDKINDLVFKPYEANVLSRKNGSDDVHRPLSKTSSVDENMSDESNKSIAKKDLANSRVSSRNSNRESPASVNSNINNNNNNNNNNIDNKNHNNNSVDVTNDSEKSQSELSKSPKESPRSSLDLLSPGQAKDLSGLYKAGFNPFYPAGMDPTNPAFRSSFTSALSQHHASMLAAAAAGYPPNTPNPYLSYARIKTPTGGEALVPVCKDAYCNCQYSAHNQQMLMGVPCPPGCTQCEQQKYGLAMAMSSSLPPNHPFAQMSKPFACNWLIPDGYCGRRFSTTDELIQHMKTHSPNLSDPATAASILAAQQQASLMPPLFFPPGLHRTAAAGYPASTSPLSPLSASRFHPYAKPGALPTSAYSSFNPALSAYYPPYSWMTPSQRIGAAASAHP